MDQMEIRQLVARQRAYFQSGATLPARARVEALRALRSAVAAREEELNDALRADLGKSAFESYMCEVGMVLSELTYMIRRTPAFAADRRVRTPLAQFAARSYVKPSPYGTVLIMSPWNYPLLLTLDPLIDALAAGNTAVVKPSAYSPATSRVIARLLAECFPPEHVSVVTGGRQENACLLEQKFDYIFFTGSQAVGREVLLHAAQYLTPVTLELGGKSPCIVDETADLKLTARRIVFGKYLNCGQTCVAPDYLLCQESVKDALLEEIVRQITVQFGPAPLDSPSYGKIVNQKHFQRLLGLIQPEKVVCGGTWQEEALRIAPTVMDAVTWQDPVMGEEIFGPILPVLTFSHIPEVLELLKDRRLDVDLYVLGSVCEEVDSTGAVTAAYGVVPDLCAAVDVTHGDSPDAPKEKTFPLGKGPVIGVGPNCTRWMEQRMRRKAEELGMAVQTEVMAGHSGTNGWPLQVSREGVATAVLSLPLRYMHTPIEVISRRDLEDLARLLAAFVEGIGEEAESR